MMNFVLLVVFITITLSSQAALAQQSPVTKIQGIMLQADTMERDTVNELVTLAGNVQVIYKDHHLKAERVSLNLRQKTLDAYGQVIITSSLATIGGSRVTLDYETNTGIIYNGYVQAGNVIFEGSILKKTSETDYIADDAKYTTCTTCPEAWSFSGKNIRAELGGYAYMKSSLLKFGGVPVFWMPYLIVPLKSDRQTGLLTPDFESSDSGGLAFSQGFFWAMSRSHDSTWTLKNYDLRGLKGLLNYRYMLAENSYGELDAAVLTDKVFAKDSRLNNFRDPSQQGKSVDRWFLKYSHYYDMPDGFVQRAQLNNASDLQYSKDFPLETMIHGDSAMENRVSVTKNDINDHFMIDSSYYINFLQSDPHAGNNDSVHRLPEVAYSITQTRIQDSDFLYSFDVNYVNFARNQFGYDDLNAAYNPVGSNDRHLNGNGPLPECSTSDWHRYRECYYERDGVFDENKDLIRTGQRLDIRPTLYRPIQYKYVELLPKLTYRETQYYFDVGDQATNTRRYIRAELSARSTFSRVFSPTEDPKGRRIKHEIQPEISFTTIPWLDQAEHPFFGVDADNETPFSSEESISDVDLNSPYGLQFDYNDRVYDRKLVTFAVVNRLIEKIWNNNTPSYRQFLSWRLAQSYDAYQAENRDDPQPFSDILSDLKVNLQFLEVYQRANYYPYQNVANTSTRLRYNARSRDFIQVAHILSYAISPGQDVDRSTRTEDLTLTLKKGFSWFDIVGKLTYDINPAPGVERLKSWGYGAQLKLPGDCWYVNLTHYRITGGDTNFKFNFAFIWDGQEKPSLPETLLDSFGF